jgi:hypothetical protein
VGCERSYAAALQRGITHGRAEHQHIVHAAVKASVSTADQRVCSEHKLQQTESKLQQQQLAAPKVNAAAAPTAAAAAIASSRTVPSKKIAAHPEVKHVFSVDVQLTQNAWGFDTMASAACSGNRRLFTSLRSCAAVPVKVADGGVVNVSQIGTVELRLRNTHGDIVRIAIGDVLFHEQFASSCSGRSMAGSITARAVERTS